MLNKMLADPPVVLKKNKDLLSPQPTRHGSPSAEPQELHPAGMQGIGQRVQERSYTAEAAGLMTDSWRPAAQEAYNYYITKWKTYVTSLSVSLWDPTPVDVANFLAYLFMKGTSRSAINTARSALSAFLPPPQNGPSIGSRPEVCRILKGVFERRPALPRYNHTWDVDMVLAYLAAMPDIEDMSLKDLTLAYLAAMPDTEDMSLKDLTLAYLAAMPDTEDMSLKDLTLRTGLLLILLAGQVRTGK